VSAASPRATLVSVSLLLACGGSRGVLGGVNGILVHSEALRSPSWAKGGRGWTVDVKAWADRFLERDDEDQCASGSRTLSFGK
jgi:hypothetical protein